MWIELQGQVHLGQISNGHAQNFKESVIDRLQWKRVVSFVSWKSHSVITLVQWRKAVIRREQGY